MHAATSKVENSAQGSSCKLKFVHASGFLSMTFPFVKSVKFDAISLKRDLFIFQSHIYAKFKDGKVLSSGLVQCFASTFYTFFLIAFALQ
jgi:hypothetical protein